MLRLASRVSWYKLTRASKLWNLPRFSCWAGRLNSHFFYFTNIQSFMEKEDTLEKEEVAKCLTPKEIKALVRPEFEANPQKFYPTQTFLKMGFSRAQCKCGHFYWRKSEKATTCGDSACKGKYTFIGKGCGIGIAKKLTYIEAWKSFERSLTTARIPCNAISRFPVMARWRNDVDYVAAGIYCFQPYCVTGELEPPANPLICPQFCVRFNDLDNIGLTGRHYSGFVMIGIQVFNKPDKYVFFKEETIEFNYRWLTEQLKIDPEEITFVQDIWAGGGNMGPCVEYFIHGLQLGNMVFMQYKYDNEGKYEELPVKVIDVGVGLERIPWLVNGSPTSYYDVFATPFKYLVEKLQLDLQNDIWEKLGPYSCMLDVDEIDNIGKTWEDISELIKVPVAEVKKSILPIKELYVVLDHTRTVFMIIQDGGLPGNTGGGSNCRNVLRRVFAILKKNDWWSKIGELEGLLKLFEMHKTDLSQLYGEFQEYKSFNEIISLEYERWSSTEGSQKKKLETLLTKSKGKLSLDNWIMAIQSWGIPADAIAQISGSQIPDNLYNQMAKKAQHFTKQAQKVFYQTITYPQTQNLYYKDHRLYQFNAKIVGVLKNVKNADKGHNIVLLDRSAFYPTSGGQANDLGSLTIAGDKYQVVNVEKVGKCFLHYLDREVEVDKVMGVDVEAEINVNRRTILRCHHTGTHVVYAAARRILGPHVWQNGAKKTQEYAHLDLTHYSSLSKEKEMQIQNEANKIILQGHPINKYFQNKTQAQKKHGFHLYQGGIVPGNEIRVVNIEGVDVQACCGTHCDNTSEVGWIKIFKSSRISDGILRLYYVAGPKVVKVLNEESKIINDLKDLWGINQNQILQTAERFFTDYKKSEKMVEKQKMSLLSLQVKHAIESKRQKFMVYSLQTQLTLYFSSMNTHLIPLMQTNKSMIFMNDRMIFGLIVIPQHLDTDKLIVLLKEDEPQEFEKKFNLKKGVQYGKGKDKVKKDMVIIIKYSSDKLKDKKVMQFLTDCDFEMIK